MFAGTISVELIPPPLTGLTLKLAPEQIAAGKTASIKGFGSTSTLTVKSNPTQLPSAPEVGVTV